MTREEATIQQVDRMDGFTLEYDTRSELVDNLYMCTDYDDMLNYLQMFLEEVTLIPPYNED